MSAKFETLDEYLDDLDSIKEKAAARFIVRRSVIFG